VDRPRWRCSFFLQHPDGIASLAAFCHVTRFDWVAMEATGGYEQQAFAQLSGQDQPVAILNPRVARQFAQSMGRLEKTDTIDAGMIAWYAEVKKSLPLCLAPRSRPQLRAPVTRLHQLSEVRTAQLNQQSLITVSAVQATFDQFLGLIAGQIRQLEHWNRKSPRSSMPTRCGMNSTRPSAPSRACPIVPWPA